MEYSAEQLKAAYALNLCTVSVSQIIDYGDLNVMEQEYEAILNNLNLEQIPHDEALLTILKQILDTITFFRIQDGEKKIIEAEYQQRMKNAIWAAVPNIGLVVTGGNPVTMAVSLASQVGTGYMNYRKNIASIRLDADKNRWELEQTAIEQFNGLRRELFDTAWRLSKSYNFPDQLRLTERQIRQYDSILMDTDLIRKYERMDAIHDSFLAYPPFWYQFGSTTNAIARSNLPLSAAARAQYSEIAKRLFLKYREINDQGLLREDQMAASCALELIDLLDFQANGDLISKLIEEAVSYSGRANDVMQLAAIDYLKLNDHENAAKYLRQLVNEQCNTVLNAQMLSSIYVRDFAATKSSTTLMRYETLKSQVGECYLYPLPSGDDVTLEDIDKSFISNQRQVLVKKFVLTMKAFIEKYLVRFGKLIPDADGRNKRSDSFYIGNENSIQMRMHEFAKVFASKDRAADYIATLQDASFPYALIDLLNEMFQACCSLDLMTDAVQARLSAQIEKALIDNRERVNSLNARIQSGQVDYFDMEKMLDIRLFDFTEGFFLGLSNEIDAYIDSRNEMQDFAIAEENLSDFCESNGLPNPSDLFEMNNGFLLEAQEISGPRFGIELLGEKAPTEVDEISREQKMLALIRDAIPKIVISGEKIEFFTNEDPRKERYFRNNEKLKSNGRLMANTLAILDDKTRKSDCDLLFTTQGIVPIKKGSVKSMVAYADVSWSTGKTSFLVIDGKFENASLNLKELYKLTQSLQQYAAPMPFSESSFKLEIRNPFAKK